MICGESREQLEEHLDTVEISGEEEETRVEMKVVREEEEAGKAAST